VILQLNYDYGLFFLLNLTEIGTNTTELSFLLQ